MQILVRAFVLGLAFAATACVADEESREPGGPPAEPDLVDRLRALPHVVSVVEREPALDQSYAPPGYRILDVGFDQQPRSTKRKPPSDALGRDP